MAVLLMLTAGVGAIAVRLRQPLIVAFIAVGILVGPSVLGWVSANDQIDLLAKLGITLLLFVVGLKLDLHIIRTMGPLALATGLGQVAFTSIIGYLIGLALGMAPATRRFRSGRGSPRRQSIKDRAATSDAQNDAKSDERGFFAYWQACGRQAAS